MGFHHVMGIEQVPDGCTMIYRTAVRGVVHRNGKLLMIMTAKGDYKFPGGGVEAGEDKHSALAREIQEETGFRTVHIGELLGTVIQQNKDKFEENKYFVMESVYFACEIDEQHNHGQSLDDYEAELEFKPEFVSMESAIHTNEELLRQKNLDINPWVARETMVLKELLDVWK